MALNIKSIRIEGFRGFNKSKEIKIDSPFVLFFGGNHQGKSSILNAIEWCLFGDLCIGKQSDIRERVGMGERSWRVINDNADKAHILLEMEDENSQIEIERSKTKSSGRKGEELLVSYADSRKFVGSDAEEEINKIINISYRDFATNVYQHQENIRDFVINEASSRSDAIERLLGLQNYRNILQSINKSDLTKLQKSISSEFESFQEKFEESIKYKKREIEEKTQIALTLGLNNSQISQKNIIQIAKAIVEKLKNFAINLGIKLDIETEIESWEDTKRLAESIRNESMRLMAELPDLAEQKQLNLNLSRLESLVTKYNENKNSLKIAEKTYDDFVKENGIDAAIEMKIKDINESIYKLDAQIKEISPRANLIIEGISFLEKIGSKSDLCPLCGKQAPNLIDFLKKEYKENIEEKISTFQIKISELNEKKLIWELSLNEFNKLKSEKQTLSDSLELLKIPLNEILGANIGKIDDPVTILRNETKIINDRLKEIRESVEGKTSKLNEIMKSTEPIGLIYQILYLKENIEKVNKIQETKEFNKQEEIKDNAAKVVSCIGEIKKALTENLKREASEKVGLADKKISDFFSAITCNPNITKINLKFHEDNRTGLNLYTFEDQDLKDPIPILSQGDLNSLALSIFLSLAKATKSSSPLGFILMDDPTQSLDNIEKENLAKVINDLGEDKNIIISTMDEEFKELLKSNITKSKKVCLLNGWDPTIGPNIFIE